jgi:hypothetical protein
LRVVDEKDVVLRLFTMMMENANNITMERKAKFSLMMENPNINTMDKNIKFAFKVFTFDQGRLRHLFLT